MEEPTPSQITGWQKIILICLLILGGLYEIEIGVL